MATQIELPSAKEMQVRKHTPMDLLQVALTNGAAIDVIERLAALQEKAMKWDAEVRFNEAMNAAQADIGRIGPDLQNPETHSRYASYAKLDKILRPIYVRNGFSLSFDTADAQSPEMVRAVCYVSHLGGHTRRYQADVPADGKGPKGGSVMTKTHASGAAMSYGQRYLLKFIFNVAIGEDDTDGNGPAMTGDEANALQEWIDSIASSASFDELDHNFREAWQVNTNNQTAKDAIIAAKDKRRGELRKAGVR